MKQSSNERRFPCSQDRSLQGAKSPKGGTRDYHWNAKHIYQQTFKALMW